MLRTIVTGGAGFIGSHLVDRLLALGEEVFVIDNFAPNYPASSKRANLSAARSHPDFHLIELDLRDAAAVGRAICSISPDVVYHLAALAGVRPSIDRPADYADVNINGTIHLLEAIRRHDPDTRFVFASSSSVYGDPAARGPAREADAATTPISPYAATKRSCELMAHVYHQLHHIPTTGLRLFTAYGPRNRPDLAIHRFAERIVAGRPIPVYGDGSTRRDYTFVGDIVDGFVRAAARCQGYALYNLGSSRPIGILGMIEALAAALGLDALVEHVPEQPGDVRETWADVTRAREELGYAPQTSFAEGIRRFADWFRAVSPSSGEGRAPAEAGHGTSQRKHEFDNVKP